MDTVVRRVVNSLFIANTFLVTNPETRETIVIDPGSNHEKIIQAIEENSLRPIAIIATHGHIDHVLGTHPIKEKYHIPFYIHYADEQFLTPEAHTFLEPYMDTWKITIAKPDKHLEEGILEIGSIKLEIIHTPGHTPGGVCIYIGDKLFTGDTLFRLSIGRTDFGGNIEDLINSIHNKIFKLPKNTIIYPGHGEETTVEHEIQHNPYMGINGLYPYKQK